MELNCSTSWIDLGIDSWEVLNLPAAKAEVVPPAEAEIFPVTVFLGIHNLSSSIRLNFMTNKEEEKLIQNLASHNRSKKEKIDATLNHNYRQEILAESDEKRKWTEVPTLSGETRLFKRVSEEGELKEGVSWEQSTDGKIYLLTSIKIGQGAMKKAKIAYNFQDQELFVRCTGPFSKEDRERALQHMSREEQTQALIVWERERERALQFMSREAQTQALFVGEREFVQLFHAYQFKNSNEINKIAMMMEYCNLGDLQSYIKLNRFPSLEHLENKKLFEKNLIPICFEILSGIKKLKEKGYVHRDLKSENIYLVRDDQNKVHAKIGDFGFITKEDKWNEEMVCTPGAISPELLDAALEDPSNLIIGADQKLDLWGYGLILHEIIFGIPFYPKLIPGIYRLKPQAFFPTLKRFLNQKEIDFHLEDKNVGVLCPRKGDPVRKKLFKIMKSILIVNVAERPSVDEVYESYREAFKEELSKQKL